MLNEYLFASIANELKALRKISISIDLYKLDNVLNNMNKFPNSIESKDVLVANILPHKSLSIGIINVPRIKPIPNIHYIPILNSQLSQYSSVEYVVVKLY